MKHEKSKTQMRMRAGVMALVEPSLNWTAWGWRRLCGWCRGCSGVTHVLALV